MLRNVLLYTMGLAVLSQANTLWSAETSAAETAPLIKCSPYLQAMDQNSVTVVWHTTRPSISWVNYQEKGTDEKPMTAISSTYGLKDIGLIQKITLKDLKPGTTYTYEINSKEVTKLEPYKFDFGAEESMKDKNGKTFTFTTWPEKADTFSFVMINDLHDDNAKHEKLLKATDADTAAFICYNGDIEPDKMNDNDMFTKFLNVPINTYAWEKCFFMLRGNHETRGAMARKMHDYFPTKTDQFYYTFQYGDVFFVNLDCGEDKIDGSKEYGGLVDFDSYRNEQVEFLKKVVKMPEYKKARYRVFFCHIPPVGGKDSDLIIRKTKLDGTVEDSKVLDGDPWHGDMEIYNKFLPFMMDNKADLLLCGHYHRLFNTDYIQNGKVLPVLVNSNVHGVRLDVTTEKITYHIFDQNGKEIFSKDIPARKKSRWKIF